MRLYHVPHTRSTRVLWMLEEIGKPYEVTILTREDEKTPEHLARHPLGRVPVLETSEGCVFESAALCLHLADLNPEAGLLPAPGTHDRALAYQWSFYSMAELEPAIVEVYLNKDSDAARTAAGTKQFHTVAAVVEQALAGKEYLVANRFSAADIVCGGVLGFAQFLGLTGSLPNVEAYLERLNSRPARQRALAVGP